MSRHAYYALTREGPSPRLARVAEENELEIWHPSLTQVAPSGMRRPTTAVWWLMHHGRAFANRDYAVVTVRKDGRLVHHTCVFPRYFRFPFMSSEDLQFGDIWTDPAYRGRGLAGEAIAAALADFGVAGRRFWYLTETSNQASRRVAEKTGFNFVGEGDRQSRYGLRLFGQFVLDRGGISTRRLAG